MLRSDLRQQRYGYFCQGRRYNKLYAGSFPRKIRSTMPSHRSCRPRVHVMLLNASVVGSSNGNNVSKWLIESRKLQHELQGVAPPCDRYLNIVLKCTYLNLTVYNQNSFTCAKFYFAYFNFIVHFRNERIIKLYLKKDLKMKFSSNADIYFKKIPSCC